MNNEISRQRVLCSGRVAAGFAAAAVAASATAGPTWDVDYEDDAKQTASTAQIVTTALDPYISIHGRLTGSALIGGGDFVDMYQIHIANPTLVSISTAGGVLGGSSTFDSQLFIFKRKGQGNGVRALGLRGNNDAAAEVLGARIGDESDPTSNYSMLSPGFYYIAITGAGTSAVSNTGQLIWPDLGQPGWTVSGNERELADWAGEGQAGEYVIRLQAVNGYVPAPGAIAVLGLAGLLTRRRR